MEQLENNRINAKIMKRSKTSFDIFSLFYLFIHLLTFISIAYFSDNYWNSYSIYHHFILSSTSISAFVLFFIVKNNPGYIEKEQSEKLENINSGMTLETKDFDISLVTIEKFNGTNDNTNKKNIVNNS